MSIDDDVGSLPGWGFASTNSKTASIPRGSKSPSPSPPHAGASTARLVAKNERSHLPENKRPSLSIRAILIALTTGGLHRLMARVRFSVKRIHARSSNLQPIDEAMWHGGLDSSTVTAAGCYLNGKRKPENIRGCGLQPGPGEHLHLRWSTGPLCGDFGSAAAAISLVARHRPGP